MSILLSLFPLNEVTPCPSPLMSNVIGSMVYMEGGNCCCIWVYLSFIQHRRTAIVYNVHVSIYSLFDTGTNCKDLELVFLRSLKINWQQNHRESSLHVGWMRVHLTCNNSISNMHMATYTNFIHSYMFFRCLKVLICMMKFMINGLI